MAVSPPSPFLFTSLSSGFHTLWQKMCPRLLIRTGDQRLCVGSPACSRGSARSPTCSSVLCLINLQVLVWLTSQRVTELAWNSSGVTLMFCAWQTDICPPIRVFASHPLSSPSSVFSNSQTSLLPPSPLSHCFDVI